MNSQTAPILLFDDECGVCRRIARWVQKSAGLELGSALIVRPIGNDPAALRALNPDLDIWEAYATIHVVMADGSMKVGGEAIAEVFRDLPSTRWFAWTFALGVLGFRPFQSMLNLAYVVLADVRPLFGCESCGTPTLWVRSLRWLIHLPKLVLGGHRRPTPIPHFTSRDRAVTS